FARDGVRARKRQRQAVTESASADVPAGVGVLDAPRDGAHQAIESAGRFVSYGVGTGEMAIIDVGRLPDESQGGLDFLEPGSGGIQEPSIIPVARSQRTFGD